MIHLINLVVVLWKLLFQKPPETYNYEAIEEIRLRENHNMRRNHWFRNRHLFSNHKHLEEDDCEDDWFHEGF